MKALSISNEQTRVHDANARIVLYQSNDGVWHLASGYTVGGDVRQLIESANLQQITSVVTERVDRRISRVVWLTWFLVILGLILGGWTILNRQRFDKLDDLATFLTGTTGTLWALAGVLLVYVAFQGQQRQSQIQEAELTATRQQVQQQQFENTFFQLLRLHHDLVDTMEVIIPEPDGGTFRGRPSFPALYGYYEALVKWDAYRPEMLHSSETLRRAYDKLYESQQYQIGHYFRNLYHIVKFIDQHSVSDKRRYAGILRAQLSGAELLLLFYNGLSEYGTGFKPLIEKYALLHNMPRQELIDRGHDRHYAPDAYGGVVLSRAGH